MKNKKTSAHKLPLNQNIIALTHFCLLGFFLLSWNSGWSTALAAKATKTPKNNTAGSAYDVIAGVNQIRAANGLAPLQVNAALMAAAQSHSQYQASIGQTTHIGSGGSDVKTRALAAGYGGGSDVSVIENIYGGMGATPARAVSWWQGDGPHLNTMVSTRHNEVGAGIATSGEMVFITLVVGAVNSGAPAPANPGPAVSASPAAVGPAQPTAVAYFPVNIATPQPDGSLIHIVQPGQTLWTIAASYQVPLPDLLQLNGFTESSTIFPGDQVVVKPADPQVEPTDPDPPEDPSQPDREPVIDPALTRQPTVQKPASQIPVTTADPAVHPLTAQPTGTPAAPISSRPESSMDPMLLIVAALVVSGTFLLIIGNLLRRGG